MKKTGNKGFWLGLFIMVLTAILAFATCSSPEGDNGGGGGTPTKPSTPTTPNEGTPSTPSTPSTIAVTGVSLKTSTSLVVGGTETLTAIITPSNATNQNVTWSSSNTAVATVSADGVVTGVSAGTAIITVTTVDGGKTASCNVTIAATSAELPALIGTVSINGIAEVEQTLTAVTTSLGGNGTISYQWKRGSTNIGTNSNTYQVQAADMGSTITVTVTRSGNSGSVTSDPTAVVTGETPPTPGLAFTLTGSSYSVSRGTATAAEVIIPAVYEGKPVTTIEYNGFSSYTNMTSIRIPDRITTINSNAFYNCTALTSVIIPSSVTYISPNVFMGCTALTSITIPFFGSSMNGTSPLGYFFGAPAYNNQNDYIPASLRTVIITGGNNIPAYAFNGCTRLTSVTIPESVKSIGQSAFNGCTGLTSITFNATDVADLTSSSNVFENAGKNGTGITVNIGANVEKIPAYIFYGSNSSNSPKITAVNFAVESECQRIGQYAFYNCTSLTSVLIPDNVMSIGDYAFYGCTGLTSVIIPDNVTSIGGYAFYGCSGLTGIMIPDNVTSIGPSALGDCKGLTSITVASGNTGYRSEGNCLIQGSLLLLGCKTSVIPYNVTSIGVEAFYNCTGLTNITIPNNVTNIGNSAFKGCTGLTNITIPNNVTKFGNSVFNNCTSLTSITIPYLPYDYFGYFFGATNYSNQSSYVPVSLKTVIMTGGSSVPANAFYNCYGLMSITIPDSVTRIGDSAFRYCKSLRSIILPFIGESKNATTYRSVFGYIFGYTTSSSGYASDPTYFDGSTFYHYDIPTSLNTVVITGVNNIPASAFYGCIGLIDITIPDNVTSIGAEAFSCCLSLRNIIIPNNVTSISDYTFYRCENLTSVTIPNNVTSIGLYAFAYCNNLMSIKFQGIISSEKFNGTAFGSGNSTFSPWTLRATYLATEGGIGTYTRPNTSSTTWTRIN